MNKHEVSDVIVKQTEDKGMKLQNKEKPRITVRTHGNGHVSYRGETSTVHIGDTNRCPAKVFDSIIFKTVLNEHSEKDLVCEYVNTLGDGDAVMDKAQLKTVIHRINKKVQCRLNSFIRDIKSLSIGELIGSVVMWVGLALATCIGIAYVTAIASAIFYAIYLSSSI